MACKSIKSMAPQVGFEPTTLRLTAECSTVELLRNRDSMFITAFLRNLCQTSCRGVMLLSDSVTPFPKLEGDI